MIYRTTAIILLLVAYSVVHTSACYEIAFDDVNFSVQETDNFPPIDIGVVPLFYLDGTAIESGGSNYFQDKSGCGRDFLITNKDFSESYFPYKSSATISAPAGDTSLIAADINNFLYADDGTPNEIPVTALFENVDYNNRLFCRHIDETLDGDGVQTTEPHIDELAMYPIALTGSWLALAQDYFLIPNKDENAKWCSPGGNDGNPGTENEPFATIQHAIDNEDGGNIIYLLSQNPFAITGDMNNNNNNNLYGVGLCVVDSDDGTNILLFENNPTGLRGCIIETNQSVNARFTGCNNLEINKCVFDFNGGTIIGNVASVYNSIFKGTYAFAGSVLNINGVGGFHLKNCIFETNNELWTVAIQNKDELITIEHNVFNVTGRENDNRAVMIWNTCSGGTLVRDNYFEPQQDVSVDLWASANRGTSGFDLEVCYNTFKSGFRHYKLLEIKDHQLTTPYIHHNIFEYTAQQNTCRMIGHQAANTRIEYNIFKAPFLAIHGDDLDGDIQDGELEVAGLTMEIHGNKIMVYRNEQFHIVVGYNTTDADNKIQANITKNYIDGYYRYNQTGYGAATGVIVQNQCNSEIKWNRIYGCAYGIHVSAGADYSHTSGGVQYNLLINNNRGAQVSGMDDVAVVNNTVITDADYGLYIQINTGGAIIKNNIVVMTGVGTVYAVVDNGDGDSDIDHNIYYCPNGTLRFKLGGIDRTFAQWRAEGNDINGAVLTADQFDTLFSDYDGGDYSLSDNSFAVGAGENLGTGYDYGLDAATAWGDDDETPEVITKQQSGGWDIGAYVK